MFAWLWNCPYLNLCVSVNVCCTCAKSGAAVSTVHVTVSFQKCLHEAGDWLWRVLAYIVNSSCPHPNPALCGSRPRAGGVTTLLTWAGLGWESPRAHSPRPSATQGQRNIVLTPSSHRAPLGKGAGQGLWEGQGREVGKLKPGR